MNELHSEISHLEKYRFAWKALQGSSHDDAANAKCWLTYRAFDGEITLKDWKKHIEPVEIQLSNSDYRVRWEVSIHTAIFYLATLHGDKERAEQAAQKVISAPLDQWPGSLLSWCRVMAIRAFEAILAGDHSACAEIITKTFSTWQSVMGNFDPIVHPVRFIEALDDMRVLHMITLMSQKVGILPDGLLDQKWLNVHKKAIEECGQPWIKCLQKIASNADSGVETKERS
jgi:hypothetical protein